jgi:Xaa-Pro aminopeptidase
MISRAGRRQAAVRAWLGAQGLDAVVVSGSANVRYLTGFSGSAAQLLVASERSVLITDFRYRDQAAAEIGGDAEVKVERWNLWEGLRNAVAGVGAGRVAIDRNRITLSDLDEAEQLAGVEWVRARSPVEGLRSSKEPDEIAAIREAARLAAEAFQAILATVVPGRTEMDIATDLEAALRRRGSEWHPFQPIVASGPRSALPHATASTRVVERGDWLILDFGAKISGYCSDLTRTVVVGAKATARQREVYEAVRRAQARAAAGIRASMTGKDADSLARDLLAREGFGEAFGHSLGHGIGLEVHESPRLSQRNLDPLPVGSVVTLEPGVYLEGWGGVRIEDDVVLTAAGAEWLSDGRTDLIELT